MFTAFYKVCGTDSTLCGIEFHNSVALPHFATLNENDGILTGGSFYSLMEMLGVAPLAIADFSFCQCDACIETPLTLFRLFVNAGFVLVQGVIVPI